MRLRKSAVSFTSKQKVHKSQMSVKTIHNISSTIHNNNCL